MAFQYYSLLSNLFAAGSISKQNNQIQLSIRQDQKVLGKLISYEMTFLGNKICPFAHRVWLTLLEKQVDFTFTTVNIFEKEPFFTQAYLKAYGRDPKSTGKVPVLIHGDLTLTQSYLVAWYVAQTFTTGSSLIPEDIFQRLKMRRFIQEIPSKIVGSFYSTMALKNKDKTEELTKKVTQNINESFKLLQSEIVGPYVLGAKFSLTDILVYPWLERWIVNESYWGIYIPKQCQKVHNLIKAMQERPSVKKALSQVSNEYYIQGYTSYMK